MELRELCGVLDSVWNSYWTATLLLLHTNRIQAGAGKTILTYEPVPKNSYYPRLTSRVLRSIVVNHLDQHFENDGVTIAYIYCSYKEQEHQTAVNLIASLLQQLVQRNPVISNDVVSLYHHHNMKQTRPTLDELSKLLQSEVRRISKVFIVIDALDECPEGNRTRESFLTEIRKLQPTIYLLVTSRHILAIEREFEQAARIDIYASGEDVKKYLKYRIESEGRLVRLVKPDPALQAAIVNTIVENAKGM